MKALDTQLEGNETKDEVEQLLDKLCDDFPPLAPGCRAFVHQYKAKIVDLIVDDVMDPDKICKEIDLCTSNQG